ncbi:MAG: mucoidy inhibitor MuiA family protein [Hamadaea sp.]|nr:mucoidy inhibitor MuiA family protein [Hamadaea sp.]NUR48387.1 mucoidy inhibitor MuiA family protein [Hamadaea sp.]NUT03449.1 mucoidy inhibitor MuiA family protein [Hamadaea sp.]
MSAVEIAAPITAVTVFPDRARVTRSGVTALSSGEQQVAIGPLPLGLLRDSIRVTGRGPATVLGVDLITRRAAEPDDELVTALEAELREIDAQVAGLADADQVATARVAFLERLAMRTASALSTAEMERVGAFADGLDAQHTEVLKARRERERLRDDLLKRRAAAERRLADLRGRRQPDRLLAVVTLTADEEGEVDLDLSYVVTGASWTSSFDLRLTGERLALSWYALVTQQTGEDWPEADLRLSTARPAGALSVPELDPWYVDVHRPLPPAPGFALAAEVSDMAVGAAIPRSPAAAPPAQTMAKRAAPMRDSFAAVEQGPVAATYRPQRPIAVPADGTGHRTVIGTFEMQARLDYVTAPVKAEEAVLRATVVNSTTHTLPPGRASLFHDGDFVGATSLEPWAPEEERELALGVDDRVRVERELTKRSASKATLGSTRRTETEYEIRVANHGDHPITVTVLDQLPVTRDGAITVKETIAEPAPAERSDLGVLTWKLALAPQGAAKIRFGVRVEAAKGVEIAGWRD